jgi:predicted nucleotidyltransferase
MVKVLEENLGTVRALCQQYHVKALDAFGSVLTEAFDETDSDVDFLVEFDAIPVRDYADNYFGLKEALEALFDRPVDLVEFAPLRNPYFMERIRASRMPVYVA